MPTYDYKCGKCGHSFEQFQSITDDSLTKCPECGGQVKRLISTGAGVIFKGNGFYQTDYKNSGKSCPSEEKTSAPCKETGDCPYKK